MTTPTILVWDEATGQWVYVASAGGGGGGLTEAEIDAVFLKPSEILAGTNITVTESDGAITISSDHTHPFVNTSRWNYIDSTSMANPGPGNIRGDTAPGTPTNNLAIHSLSATGIDKTDVLLALVEGDLIVIQEDLARENWVRFTVNGPVINNGSWFQIPVLATAVGGVELVRNDDVLISFTYGTGGGGGGGGGTVVLSGTATPTDVVGNVGDYYLDTDDQILYGPKSGGVGGAQYVTPTLDAATTNPNMMAAMKFQFGSAGVVTGIRINANYAGSLGWEAYLFTAGGTLLASKDFSPVAGWNDVMFTTPVSVSAATVYVAAFFLPDGGAAVGSSGTAYAGQVSGNVTGIAASAVWGFAGRDTFPTAPAGIGTWGVSPIFGTAAVTWPIALKSVPPGGTASQVLAKASGTDYAVGWSTPAAGGAAPVRATVSKTTASLAAGAAEQSTIALAASYRLMQITTTASARVRLYTTAAKQVADLTRAIGDDPIPSDHGLVFEFVTTPGLLSADLSPVVDGFDGKITPDGLIPITITNLGASPIAISCTLAWIRTE